MFFRSEIREVRKEFTEAAYVLAFFISSIVMIYIGYKNFFVFHSYIQLLCSLAGATILVESIKMFKTFKEPAFLILGVPFGIVSVFEIINGFVYSKMSILWDTSTTYIYEYLWMYAAYLCALSILVFAIMLDNTRKYIKLDIAFLFYILGIIILIFLIVNTEPFKDYFSLKNNISIIYETSIFIIGALLITGGFILIRDRNHIDWARLEVMEMGILFMILTGVLSILYAHYAGTLSVIAYIFKFLSYVFIAAFVKETFLYRTESSKFGKKILRNDECYNLLVEESEDAIIVHSEGKILFANREAKNIFDFNELGYSSMEEFVKNNCHENSLKSYDIKITNSKGEDVFLQNRQVAFSYKGKPATLNVIKNIYFQKQIANLKVEIEENEKILKKIREDNSAILNVFSTMSHELKTPLNVILSAVQVLNLNCKDKFKIKYFKIIKQNCYRLLRMVNNIVDISRIDSGFYKLNLSNQNIVSIVENITLSVADYVESNGVSLIFDTDVEEKIMSCDPDKIERIMLNLLSNAIKFTDPGDEIRVNVFDKGNFVHISVSDTGIGIPEDKLSIIFERFRQVDDTLYRNVGGSGIGLSLVKSLVELHGGSISIKSKLGVGSEFTVKLPVRTVDEEIAIVSNVIKSDNKIEKVEIEFSDIYNH